MNVSSIVSLPLFVLPNSPLNLAIVCFRLLVCLGWGSPTAGAAVHHIQLLCVLLQRVWIRQQGESQPAIPMSSAVSSEVVPCVRLGTDPDK